MKWLRRNGWRLTYAVLLAWIAIELHRVGNMVDDIQAPDLTGLQGIADAISAK